MTRETGLWRWLKKARPELREDLHIKRTESPVASGIPDAGGKLRHADQSHIELHTGARPRRDGPVRFKVRDTQVEWMRRRIAVGGQAWLLLQVGSGHGAERYLVWGIHAETVQGGVTETTLVQMCEVRQCSPRLDRNDPADVVRRAAGLFGGQ